MKEKEIKKEIEKVIDLIERMKALNIKNGICNIEISEIESWLKEVIK